MITNHNNIVLYRVIQQLQNIITPNEAKDDYKIDGESEQLSVLRSYITSESFESSVTKY